MTDAIAHRGPDSEVVLTALAHWGVKAFDRFNGMFALAFWDRKERTLLLARDRYGIKPLYVCHQNNIFAFGSEQKAILARPGFSRRLDKPALLEYFTFQNLFTEHTLLEGIRLLPAGHYAVLDLRHEKPTLRSTHYWDYRFREPEHPASKEEYLEELDRLFRQAVNRQLVTDVEFGSYPAAAMSCLAATPGATTALPAVKNCP